MIRTCHIHGLSEPSPLSASLKLRQHFARRNSCFPSRSIASDSGVEIPSRALAPRKSAKPRRAFVQWPIRPEVSADFLGAKARDGISTPLSLAIDRDGKQLLRLAKCCLSFN